MGLVSCPRAARMGKRLARAPDRVSTARTGSPQLAKQLAAVSADRYLFLPSCLEAARV